MTGIKEEEEEGDKGDNETMGIKGRTDDGEEKITRSWGG